MESLWFTGNLAEVLVERGDLSIARETVTGPPGLPHTYRVGDEGAVYLVTTSPGRFASFVRAAGHRERREVDPERLARIAADHDITILGPPGMLPSELAATPAGGPAAAAAASRRR